MKKTVLSVKNMDCPCEENMIRMKLASFKGISLMKADIAAREFTIIHNEDENDILSAVNELNLGSSHIFTDKFDESNADQNSSCDERERRILILVLSINFAFFLIEVIYGFLSNSMGLVADSLDMLSDSLVYAMAFFAVYAALKTQKKVALISGIFQASLAAFGFFEVIRRFSGEIYEVDYKTMILVSIFALIANYLCLIILNKNASDKPHMQASKIFTSNDIIVNLGVIIAGVLVLISGSNLPDLIVGAVVFIIVSQGSVRILKLSK